MNKLATIALLALILTVANAAAGDCDTTVEHCTTCDATTDTTCVKCNAGYEIVGDDTDCTACAAGKGAASGESCEACPKNCATCTDDSSVCAGCKAGFELNEKTEACDACAAGTGAAAGEDCAACPKNCGTCTEDSAVCTGCSAGFGMVDDECTACKDANCASCDGDVSKCSDCKDGYVANDAETCEACANGCATCDKSDDSCTACPSGRILNKTDTKNQFCCPVNCTTCKAVNFCTGCIDGSNLNADKGTCFGFKTGASLTLGAIISVALFSLLF